MKVLPPTYSGNQTVEVEIFTSAFRRIQTESFFKVPPGTGIALDLRDRWGKPLANGFYYVVVTVDGRRSVAKLLILH